MGLRRRPLEGMGVTTQWKERRVLVTGGTGLLGSWIVRRLVDLGAFTVVLVADRDPQAELIRSRTIERTTVVDGRLEEYATLERAISLHETDTVLHLGAQTLVGTGFRSPLLTFEANIRGSYNLLEACRRMSEIVRRVVVASSDKAYGEAAQLPYTEETPLAGRHPYDVSKSCTDLIAKAYATTYGLPVAIARCGNIYGGGDLNWSRIVPGTIWSFLHGDRPVLRSDGTLTRDYIYVDDIVDAYLVLADALDDPALAGEAFNFAHGSPNTVVEIVEEIRVAMGIDILEPEILGTARAEIPHQHLDSSKARRELGWEPSYSLSDGLARTVEWYRSHLE